MVAVEDYLVTEGIELCLPVQRDAHHAEEWNSHIAIEDHRKDLAQSGAKGPALQKKCIC